MDYTLLSKVLYETWQVLPEQIHFGLFFTTFV